jgi:hypothetical protein
MFLRCTVRRKDGKQHRYWSVVEKTRVAGGRAHLVAPAAFEANILIAIERITGRDGGKREIVQAAAGLLLERDRLGLTGVSAAALLTTSDFDVERVLRPRVGFGPASVEARVADIGAGATPEAALRPRPRSFAVLERCSE